ncbi:MAG TPA: LCP family protein, partial [Frankiaceae bacterium]|nr:LCP family protein [Frankiaceae bacterium]
MTEAPPRPGSTLPPDLDPRGPRRAARRRRASPRRRFWTVLTVLLSVTVLLVSVGGWVAYRYFNAQITRIHLNLGAKRPPGAPEGAENFLLVGSDSRVGTGTEFGGTQVVQGQRSDTTILAHLGPDGTSTLVSFPRDTYVTIPAFRGRPTRKDKLNSAIETGGAPLLVQTIESLTKIKIDHYVSIDLAGFRAMTDAIGGVDVCVKALPDYWKRQGLDNLNDKFSQWHGRVGTNRLDGEQALAFVRTRYGLPGGDLDRIKRQQQFIGAVFRKATSTGVLINPIKLESLLSAATHALTVDDGTNIDDLRRLATRLRGLNASKVRFETIPTRDPTAADGADGRGFINGASVLVYDPPQLDAFLAPLRGDAPPAGPGGADKPTDKLTVPPSEITVAVQNGAGTPGLAGQTANALSAQGFRIAYFGNATGGGYTASEVRYGPGRADAARTVAAAVPGAVLREDSTVGSSLVLVLGSSFQGVRQVSVGGGGGPA